MDKKKKPKKYRPKNKRRAANEPMTTYGFVTNQIVTTLASFSVKEIEKAKVSGNALLDIQEETALSATDMAEILGVSKSKYYDLIKLDSLDMNEIDALADFASLWQKGLDAFDNDQEQLTEWLNTRNENLGAIKPIRLLRSRIGRRTLESAFLRIEYSTYG